MFVVLYRKWFYAVSALLVVASLASVAVWGLQYGIDFAGGSLIELEYASARPTVEMVQKQIAATDVGAFSARESGDKGFIIRTKHLTQEQHDAVISALSKDAAGKVTGADEKRFDSVGPLLGQEAARKALVSLALVILAIVLFITYAFRQVSEPVSSWKYGLIAIIALVHDVIIPTGAFAILGHFQGFEIDTLFITALLVILGFSIHDTIVVFDRVRENLKHRSSGEAFEHIVGKSISQTFVRSINTSMTVLISLVIMYFVGSEATRHFVVALLVGITAGTYSSIFLGSPLLVTFQKLQEKKSR
ncbi:MAG: protein translocase subunit SecF [Patescibacteria group bacterium]